MPITVNTNMSSLICQRSLTKATSGMNTALQRMSTGLKINSAKDDAAGCAISSKIDYKLSSYSVAQDNAQMGQSMLDTASGSLSVMNNMLQRMRDLSEQSANGTYGKEERQAMQAEVDALTKELYRIKNTTDFNGKTILSEEEQQYTEPTMNMSDVSATNWAETNGQIIGISSAEELLKLSELTNAGNDTTGRTFALTSDIDLSVLGDIDGNGSNFTAIGTSNTTTWATNTRFKGTFDGNGFTISNLTINKPTEDFQGLFGITYGATIENVNLENVDVKGKNYTGGLVGANSTNSTITNCSVSGNVTGNDSYTGGLVGYNKNSTITNCSSTGNVTGNGYYTGGLVGVNQTNSTITNCSSSGNVVGSSNVGGFVGHNANSSGTATDGSTIQNCWCSGSVTGTTNVGGFLGWNRESDIINCSYDKASTGQAKDVGSDASIVLPDSPTNPLTKAPKSVCPVNLQVGINSDTNSVVNVDTGFEMGNFNISLMSEFSATKSLEKIDAMLEKVGKKSLDLGATSNRLTSTMEFQNVQMSALTSANSLIKDADIAKESASYIKNQILQQTTATLLATANQNPSIALSLV